MFRKVFCAILGLCCAAAMTSCAKKKLEIGREDPEKEIQKCLELSRKKHYEEAVDCLEIFKSRFADTELGHEAELKIADNYFQQKEYLIAADTYQAFLKLNPFHRQADYASYRTGVAYLKEAPKPIDRDQQYLEQAAGHLEYTIRNYPDSTYLEPAKEELKKAKERMARRYFYIGRFYYRTGEYLAAIPRFEQIEEELPETHIRLKALYYRTLSHLKLGQKAEAQGAFALLQANYPEDKLTRKASKKLKD